MPGHAAVIPASLMEKNSMIRADQLPYLPCLTSSDFYLFGYGNRKLNGTSFDAGRHLLSAIEHIIVSLQKSTFDRVFSNR
jgi:hypothetical protein